MPKYKDYFKRMLTENKDLFTAFTRVHFEYENNSEKNQERFNEIGEKVQELVMEYENKLCSHSDKGQYSGYTPKLAEKFQQEVRTHFPMYDFIGVTVEETAVKPAASALFSLKQIKL